MKQEMDLERAKEIIVNWAKSKPFINKVREWEETSYTPL